MYRFSAHLQSLWNDDQGFIVSAELVLIATILVIGVLVGLTTMRDQVVQELGDMASAVGALNQSYSFGAVTVAGFTVAGSQYTDLSDFCDSADTAGDPPACIAFTVDGSPES